MSSVATDSYWSTHTHSKFSFNDALPDVTALVAKAVDLEYPALGLTDHGNMAGAVQLYKACRKVGMEPLPGIEIYVSADLELGSRETFHACLLAYTETGYRNLSRLATMSSRQFYYKPVLDLANFGQLAEDGALAGVALTTGCLGGLVPQTLIRRGISPAVRLTKALAGWFPRVYVELQNHGIELEEWGITDDDVLDGLWAVTQAVGLPAILARDSHFIEPTEKPLHDALKQLVSFSEDPGDSMFNGEGYYMCGIDEMRRFFPPKMLAGGLEGLADLANAAYVRIPELETFTLKVPDISTSGDPQEELEALVLEEMDPTWRADPDRMKWLRAEFDTIRAGQMAPYMLLVNEVCGFMRRVGIRYWARGSAGASMTLRILQVTQVDPFKLGLRPDRFLSQKRIKPPDVDLDVQHDRRDEVVNFLHKLGAVVPVGSHMKYSLWADEGMADESKGSLRVKFYSVLNKKNLPQPAWRDVNKRDKDMLYELADRRLFYGFGRHAAGFIVAPNEQVLADLPLSFIASSRTMITSYGKKDIEALGFTKLDLLGLRTATQVALMEASTGIALESIPEDDKAVFKMISDGNVEGVFQLEGWTMSKGVKKLMPRSLADISIAQALFRPAVKNSGAELEYLDRRRKRTEVPERHPDIMKATVDTYGVLLYQEQIMDVMAALGLTGLELEDMLDAIKASNEYSIGAALAIQEMLPRIRELATARGWSQVDIDWLVESLSAYADYSFNKAHAAQYGEKAYQCAWMKLHHPLDFWCALLNAYADDDKVKIYTLQVRREGIRLLPAHVNHSEVGYTMDRAHNAIRKGLMSVRGVGIVGATEIAAKAPYRSLTDFGERVLPRRVSGARGLAIKNSPTESGGMVAALDDVGAFDGLEK